MNQVTNRLGFIGSVPRTIRCLSCNRLADITKDGFLAEHDRLGTRRHCNGSGAGAQMVREGWAARTASK